MTVVFTLAGGLLLVICGVAGGFAAAIREQNKWQTAHSFLRLLEYTADSIHYKGVPAEEVLSTAAAYPEFAGLGIGSCRRFKELPIPEMFESALRSELQGDLQALELCGRESACQVLESMTHLCRPREEALHQNARLALRLYPRLGGCMGALAAILLI